MFLYSQPITPTVKSHMEAQLSLCADLTKHLFNSLQKINELNMRVTQKLMEESVTSTHQLLAAQHPTEFLSIVAAQAQPAAEKLREYQQHLADIAAGIQVDLARTAETHLPETSRTAASLMQEVAKKVSEETEIATQRQQVVMDKVKNSINKFADKGDTLYRESKHSASRSGSGQKGAGKNSHS